MEYDLTSDEEFLKNIASNVLGVLEKRSFFTRLDDLFCPVDPSIDRAKCGHSFDKSVSILRDLDMNLDDLDDVDDVEDVLGVLRFRGACCDCEVLYNMAEESRLKSEYWKAHAKQLTRESRSLTTFA